MIDAAFQGLFHGISAFCNTGLSLFPDQLRRFDNNPPVFPPVCGVSHFFVYRCQSYICGRVWCQTQRDKRLYKLLSIL
ncbi:MAG: hypothetical protein LBG87_03540 [Spirochaetaceae bacterium]|nr:hypothetical protein [Spirochaetaceae bacterium]